jgi:hypothetical protein
MDKESIKAAFALLTSKNTHRADEIRYHLNYMEMLRLNNIGNRMTEEAKDIISNPYAHGMDISDTEMVKEDLVSIGKNLDVLKEAMVMHLN